MIASNVARALTAAVLSKFYLARRRIGIFTLLVAPLAGAASAQVVDGQPKAVFAENAPAITHERLSEVSLPNTTIDSVELNPADSSCRVRATVTHPPTGCRVKVFVALPTKGWNGRFQGTGGGGYVGGNPNSLSGPLRSGYATAATDTGHDGGSGSFALGGADGRLDWHAVQDNAYLGIHEMTVLGKALSKAFYGKAPRYSYFVGGSTGGRQGLMEAQRYPEDYDGIISGCPAINWHRFIPADLWPQVVMVAVGNFVSKAKLNAATAAAVASADALDGVTDGVIDDPSHCTYDPKELVGTKVGDSTFTGSDADVVRKIWEGPRGRDGKFLWYGLCGTDLSALAGTDGSPLSGKPFFIPREWCQYFLLQDPKWDWKSLTPEGFERLWDQSVEEFGAVIGTDDPDLTRFRDRGGKIIITHGLSDQLIPADGTIDYYKRVSQRMGGTEKVGRFARLFLVPGVDHGFHGLGATPVGRLEAIIRWVEEGTPPDKLMAERRDGSGKVTRTRPLFPYPQVAKYKGSGSTDEAENFVSSSPQIEAKHCRVNVPDVVRRSHSTLGYRSPAEFGESLT